MTPLCLYTASFPYGLGEQFLETEIKYLAEHFDTIFIIPNNPTGNIRSIPPNVKVLRPKSSPYTTLRGIKQLGDRKSTRLNSSHVRISYAVFCLKKKKN